MVNQWSARTAAGHLESSGKIDGWDKCMGVSTKTSGLPSERGAPCLVKFDMILVRQKSSTRSRPIGGLKLHCQQGTRRKRLCICW
jgi:hypothetical protein